MELTPQQRKEADRLARYLAGAAASDSVARDYWRAVDRLGAGPDGNGQRIWQRMMSSPLLLRMVDSGLALTAPASDLRKRIFIMVAILETEPSLADRFLPRDRPPLYLMAVGLIALRAVLCAVAGVILVKWWRLT
jgi:hypothetical protein